MSRVLPSASEAEASLLGTMLVYPSSSRTALEEGLEADDFFIEANRRIYHACEELYQEGTQIDSTTVATRLKDTDLLDKSGGMEYILNLMNAAVTSANTLTYVNLIRDKAMMRRMIEAAERVAEEGFSGQTDLNDYLDRSEKEILNVSRNRKAGEFKNPNDVLNEVLKTIRAASQNSSEITGLKTGFNDLDRITHGLQRGDMIVLAARPSMGKTTFAMNLCENASLMDVEDPTDLDEQGRPKKKPAKPVLIFSLEMPADQIMMRMLASLSRVDQTKIRTGQIHDDEDWAKISSTMAILQERRNIFIDDSSGLTPTEVRSRARRVYRENNGLSLIMVDYLQLMRAPGFSENRTLEIAEISRSLKALAKELQVPVVALSQLNRSLEQRADKRPVNSDLRESGSIEQDADLIMFIYRDEVYNDNSDLKGVAEIIIGKQRNGPIGRVRLTFQGQYSRFDNYAGPEYDDEY